MGDLFKRLRDQKVHRVAIMGGTFDPIHYGHLFTAEAVRDRYDFDKVIFVPSGVPPHKENIKVTSSEHRYRMAFLATQSNPFFEVSRMEIDREGFTYTIDTIKELKSNLCDELLIYFITGADAMFQISTWKDAPELLSLCKFIAVTRPGYDKKALDDKVKWLIEQYNSDITIMDVPAIDISSTDIRDRVSSNVSIKGLVPENVEEYIRDKKLYSKQEKK